MKTICRHNYPADLCGKCNPLPKMTKPQNPMKITISPSEDQSDQTHPYYSISVEHPPDDSFTADRACEMFYQALLAFGMHPEHAQKAMNDFKP
jgi:hypothetical protein